MNKKANQLGLYPIYGLENACGYGRSLAVWLIEKGCIVRDILVKDGIRLKNGIHEQLMSAYPSYHKFFSEIDGKCALYFWKTYPSLVYLENKTAEELTEELKERSKSFRKDKAELILDCIRND